MILMVMKERNKVNNISDEILKAIKYAVDRKEVNCDVTYKSRIKAVSKKGYVVIDRSGSERTVKCCIPGLDLKVGQSVWVKEPMGRLMDIHIVGVV